MQSGVDVICDVEEYESDEIVRLINPMTLIYKRTEIGTVMMMTPWLPVELIEENISNVAYRDILTIVEPKEKLVDYYMNMVNVQLAQWLKTAEDIFSNFESYGDEEEEDFDEADLPQEDLEYLKTNKLLH